MKNEKGLTLIEIVIALGLMGIIVITYLGAMASSSRALAVTDEQTTAESLARSELEYIKSLDIIDYKVAPWNYEIPGTPPSWDGSHTLPGGYTGYSVNVTAEAAISHSYDDGLQKIIIRVYEDNKTNPVVTLEGYKARR